MRVSIYYNITLIMMIAWHYNGIDNENADSTNYDRNPSAWQEKMRRVWNPVETEQRKIPAMICSCLVMTDNGTKLTGEGTRCG